MRDPDASLRLTLVATLERLHGLAATHGGPADVVDYLTDPDAFPTLDAVAAAQYCRGWLEGAAEALDVTVLALLEEYGLGTPSPAEARP
jgi:hypothetical protein